MNNKIVLLVSLSIFGYSLTSFADDVTEVVITATAGGNTYSGQVQRDPTPTSPSSGLNQGVGYSEARAQQVAAEKKGRCKGNNLKARMACMSGARVRYEEQSSRCGLYSANALFYGGVATTGVATIPAVIVGGGFAIAAYYCENTAESNRDTTLQACQDSYDKWDLQICETM